MSAILKYHKIGHHVYADNTQLYISFKCKQPLESIFESCLSDSRSTYFHIRNIGKLGILLSYNACSTIIHALISCRLDYCNSLLYNVPTHKLIACRRQNQCARNIFWMGTLNMKIQVYYNTIHSY